MSGATSAEEVLDVRIRPSVVADAGEVFTVQRAAFIEEAHLYQTLDTPALTQTLEELRAELATNSGCVALVGSRMVGSVTARSVGDLLRIGRLAVVPDLQGRGIGTRLLEAVEARSDASEAELFTGSAQCRESFACTSAWVTWRRIGSRCLRWNWSTPLRRPAGACEPMCAH